MYRGGGGRGEGGREKGEGEGCHPTRSPSALKWDGMLLPINLRPFPENDISSGLTTQSLRKTKEVKASPANVGRGAISEQPTTSRGDGDKSSQKRTDTREKPKLLKSKHRPDQSPPLTPSAAGNPGTETELGVKFQRKSWTKSSGSGREGGNKAPPRRHSPGLTAHWPFNRRDPRYPRPRSPSLHR